MEKNKKCNILCAVTLTDDENITVVEKLSRDHMNTNETYNYMTADELSVKKDVFTVDMVNANFVCFRKGVLDHLSAPWFRVTREELEDTDFEHSEDYYLCESVRKLKEKIWVDPTIKLPFVSSYKKYIHAIEEKEENQTTTDGVVSENTSNEEHVVNSETTQEQDGNNEVEV